MVCTDMVVPKVLPTIVGNTEVSIPNAIKGKTGGRMADVDLSHWGMKNNIAGSRILVVGSTMSGLNGTWGHKRWSDVLGVGVAVGGNTVRDVLGNAMPVLMASVPRMVFTGLSIMVPGGSGHFKSMKTMVDGTHIGSTIVL